MRVMFFNGPPAHKAFVMTKKKAVVFTTVTMSDYHNQLNTFFVYYIVKKYSISYAAIDLTFSHP